MQYYNRAVRNGFMYISFAVYNTHVCYTEHLNKFFSCFHKFYGLVRGLWSRGAVKSFHCDF